MILCFVDSYAVRLSRLFIHLFSIHLFIFQFCPINLDDDSNVVECKKSLIASMHPIASRIRNYDGPLSEADSIENIRNKIKKQVGMTHNVEVCPKVKKRENWFKGLSRFYIHHVCKSMGYRSF